MSFNATFKAYWDLPEARRPHLGCALKAEWNGVGTAYYADVGGSGAQPRISNVSRIQRGVQVGSPTTITRMDVTVSLIDENRIITSYLEAYDQRLAPMSLYWVFHGQETDPDNWHPLFTGVLDRWEQDGNVWNLGCRTDDFWLEGYAPKVSILKGEWPNLPTESEGIFAPYCYGVLDSSNHSGAGMVKCPRVEWSSGSRGVYLVSAGTVESIDTVYKDGGAGGTYTTNRTYLKGGKEFSVIIYTSTNTPAATVKVTADVSGLTDDATETGNAITNPVTQLRHCITNFLRGDWRYDPWLSEAIIDNATWNAAATFAGTLGMQGSMHFGGDAEQVQAKTIISDWLTTYPIFRLYWNGAGKLCIIPLPTKHPGYGNGSRYDLVRRQDEIGGSSFVTSMDSDAIVKRISCSYIKDWNAGKYWSSIDVQDPNLNENTSENVPMEYGPAGIY